MAFGETWMVGWRTGICLLCVLWDDDGWIEEGQVLKAVRSIGRIELHGYDNYVMKCIFESDARDEGMGAFDLDWIRRLRSRAIDHAEAFFVSHI
jgi:hypothetical protein